MTRLIFLGPPGSGKGTQAQILAQDLNIPHISTGEILRQAMKEQTPLGIKAQHYVNSGELVPDELVQDLVQERLSQPDTQSGWILDGFPRKVTQAVFLEKLLEKLHQNGEKVVNLDAPDKVVVERLLARGRKDDTEEVIRRRLEVYRAETAPLIDYYRDSASADLSVGQKLLTVNGDQSQEEVTNELRNLIAS
ncbi:MAG: adenylate kinase [Trichormus sp. ATA11-4-KO1]|nr:adenylate kinase [Trichormus sp. ATA11-4-KO1]